jgi:hypothetical protein
VCSDGEHRHVGADLGDDHRGGPFADPGERIEVVAALSKRGHLAVDLGVEIGDGGFEVGGVVQHPADRQGVVLAEAAGPASRSCGIFLRNTPLGWLPVGADIDLEGSSKADSRRGSTVRGATAAGHFRALARDPGR